MRHDIKLVLDADCKSNSNYCLQIWLHWPCSNYMEFLAFGT